MIIQIANNFKLSILGVMIILSSNIASNRAYSQEIKQDSVYVVINKTSNLLSMKVSEDSSRTLFRILKDRFDTKEKQNEFLKKYRSFEVSHTNFYIDFIAISKPDIKSLKNIEAYSIDQISKEEFKISNKTKVFFIDSLINSNFLVYRVYLRHEE